MAIPGSCDNKAEYYKSTRIDRYIMVLARQWIDYSLYVLLHMCIYKCLRDKSSPCSTLSPDNQAEGSRCLDNVNSICTFEQSMWPCIEQARHETSQLGLITPISIARQAAEN